MYIYIYIYIYIYPILQFDIYNIISSTDIMIQYIYNIYNIIIILELSLVPKTVLDVRSQVNIEYNGKRQ